MKRILLFLMLTSLPIYLFGQTAFYEAQYLAKTDNPTIQVILSANPQIKLSKYEQKVLEAYSNFLDQPFGSNIGKLDIKALGSAIQKYNAFLENERQQDLATLQGGFRKDDYVATAFLPLISSIAGGSFSMGPDQQTKIIDGITKYYAEEFRKAQLLTYMQTFKSTIGKYGEMQVLFPQTYSKLLSADPSKFPDLGNEYKDIFNSDLRMIPEHLIKHIDNHTAKSNEKLEKTLKWLKEANLYKIKASNYYQSFKFSADVGQKLINNYHPVDLFNFLDDRYYSPNLILSNSKTSEKIILALHGLNLLQKNLLDTTKRETSTFKNAWINLQTLQALDTKEEWTYFAGLLYQQDKAFFNKFIWQATNVSLQNITDEQVNILKRRVYTILTALVELQDFRSNLKDDNLRENFSTYMDLVNKAMLSANYFTEKEFPIEDYSRFIKIAGYTMNVYDNARKKDYNNTFYYTLEILNELMGENGSYSEITNQIEQYSSFMTEVINTKNSDEVKECIKKYVAPPTSFMQKRELKWTLSITGQPGYFVGVETLSREGQKPAFVSGITLPMGFEFTFKTKCNNSIGIFAQLIDIGAVLNFRVDDQTSTLPDKIEFKQIFSPGGLINYGFRNSPLTIGLGYQYSPQLRKVTENGNELFPNGDRFLLRVTWDIPFINIAKSKSR
ncbi:hypothetical protein [Sphingobacterium faecium]|uniref:hypothetical protein n=1 Tax=Sphingobacterium faecium TaxID=34087 RepID=UPI00320928D9